MLTTRKLRFNKKTEKEIEQRAIDDNISDNNSNNADTSIFNYTGICAVPFKHFKYESHYIRYNLYMTILTLQIHHSYLKLVLYIFASLYSIDE